MTQRTCAAVKWAILPLFATPAQIGLIVFLGWRGGAECISTFGAPCKRDFSSKNPLSWSMRGFVWQSFSLVLRADNFTYRPSTQWNFYHVSVKTFFPRWHVVQSKNASFDLSTRMSERLFAINLSKWSWLPPLAGSRLSSSSHPKREFPSKNPDFSKPKNTVFEKRVFARVALVKLYPFVRGSDIFYSLLRKCAFFLSPSTDLPLVCTVRKYHLLTSARDFMCVCMLYRLCL